MMMVLAPLLLGRAVNNRPFWREVSSLGEISDENLLQPCDLHSIPSPPSCSRLTTAPLLVQKGIGILAQKPWRLVKGKEKHHSAEQPHKARSMIPVQRPFWNPYRQQGNKDQQRMAAEPCSTFL